jgi:predicted RNase H-like HicB family nuclease
MKSKRKVSVRALAETYTYTVLFEPAEEGGYVVTCPALPGLATEGDTLEQARAMAKDAISGYLECLREDGRPIPPSEQHEATPIREEVTVTLRRA